MTGINILQEESLHKSSESLLNAIQSLFFSYFDHPWQINIIDELEKEIIRESLIMN